MKGLKFILILLLLIFAVSYSFADEISFSASVNKNAIALNEYLVYSLTVSGDVSNLPEPKIAELSDFNRYGSGKSQSFSFVNGKRSGSITYTYTIAPKKTGKLTIPAAKAEYDKKTYTTDPIEIEVTEASAVQSVSVQQPQQTQQGGRVSDSGGQGKVFVKASTNKKKVYVNEKLVYKFGFYTNVDLMSNPEYYPPDFKGFWNDSSKPGQRRESIDGINYLVNDIETILYPIESGTVTIDPAKLKISVADLSSRASFDDIFSIFSAMGMRAQQKLLETESLTINVLPLPQENRPTDFKGAVGNFKISASLDNAETQVNDLVTLTVKVTGKGNMKSVNDIEFKPSKDFKVYDTVSSSNDEKDAKEFKILLVPLAPGERTIQPIRLSFFDPDKAVYSYAETAPLKIKVEGAAIVNSGNNGAVQSNIINVQSDIKYNKEINKLCQYKKYFVLNKFFFLIFIPFVLFFIFTLFYRTYLLKKNNDPEIKLKLEAAAFSRKCITESENKMKVETCRDFYETVYAALLSAITAKTGIRSDNLPANEITENLKKSGIGENMAKDIENIINSLNFYRFASVKPDEKSMTQILSKVKEILKRLKSGE